MQMHQCFVNLDTELRAPCMPNEANFSSTTGMSPMVSGPLRMHKSLSGGSFINCLTWPSCTADGWFDCRLARAAAGNSSLDFWGCSKRQPARYSLENLIIAGLAGSIQPSSNAAWYWAHDMLWTWSVFIFQLITSSKQILNMHQTESTLIRQFAIVSLFLDFYAVCADDAISAVNGWIIQRFSQGWFSSVLQCIAAGSAWSQSQQGVILLLGI